MPSAPERFPLQACTELYVIQCKGLDYIYKLPRVACPINHIGVVYIENLPNMSNTHCLDQYVSFWSILAVRYICEISVLSQSLEHIMIAYEQSKNQSRLGVQNVR